jgi:hypothetical protein
VSVAVVVVLLLGFLTARTAVDLEVRLNEINSPPQAPTPPLPPFPPLWSLRPPAATPVSLGFGVDFESTSLDLAIVGLDLHFDVFFHLLPFHRWLFRHLCLVAWSMLSNAPIYPHRPYFSALLIVPIALPLPEGILLLLDAPRCFS